VIGLLIALYPARWRGRYGEEFRAVLESRPLGPFDVADVLLGAIDARSRPLRFAGEPASDGGQLTMLRIGGLGAIAGGILWVAGLAGGSMNGGNSAIWLWLMGAGSFGILLALVGLSAFQSRKYPGLVWAAFLVPAIGSLVTIVGLYGSATQDSELPMVLGWEPWAIWMLGLIATVIGSIIFAVSTLRAEVLSRRAAISLAGSSTAFVLIGLLGMGGSEATGNEQLLIAATVIAFGGSWAWLGLSALRRGPIRAITPA
jgi:hypothetical protein